jgi:HEAT repeat protein
LLFISKRVLAMPALEDAESPTFAQRGLAMRSYRKFTLRVDLWSVPLAIALGWLGSAVAQPSSPVDEIRLLLKAPTPDLAARDQQLAAQVKQLATVSDLRRALILNEWRDLDSDPQLAATDRRHRADIARRFEKVIRDVCRQGDATSRLALLNMLTEMGASPRAVGSSQSLTRDFALEVAALTTKGDLGIREVATRTLGRINPDLDLALPQLNDLLSAPEPSLRLAAADSLASLVGVMADLASEGHNPLGVEATRKELVAVGRGVVPLAGRGLGDVDADVRSRCAAALGQAAAALRKQVPGQLPTDAASAQDEYQHRLEEERAELLPLITALKNQGTALTHALADPDTKVRLLARRALEDLTDPQLRLLERANNIVANSSPASPTRLKPTQFVLTSSGMRDPLMEGLQETVVALATGLKDGDVRARRAALDVLETLGPAAAPAAPALVEALSDRDLFVRWAAARTLGKISPVAAESAVPALAKLLADGDGDLRLAAARALERYGPAAKTAMPELIEAFKSADAEQRVAAIQTVGSIGGDEAKKALAALTAALADADARVRVAAAEVLAAFGPAAHDAVEALRKNLQDADPAVQKASGEALLNILQPIPK